MLILAIWISGADYIRVIIDLANLKEENIDYNDTFAIFFSAFYNAKIFMNVTHGTNSYSLKVERTKTRPLAAKDLTHYQAVGFLGGILSCGLMILLSLNWYR